MSRYKVARAFGKSRFEQVLKEDEELLAAYGLRLLSVHGGLRVVKKDQVRGKKINPWDVMLIQEKTWEWLRPVLVSARDLP